MQWRFTKLGYDVLIPQLDKNISQLNEQEAEAYFTWFMEMVPQRVAYVSQICSKELRIPTERMDCSPESLLLIWKWFRRRAKTEKCSPWKNAGQIPYMPKRQLTLETEYILRDIGIYLGETFLKNCENIHWTYYTAPRQDFFVNRPLLQGFVDRTTGKPWAASFEPIHMAGVQASKILTNRSRNEDLLNLYLLWSEKR